MKNKEKIFEVLVRKSTKLDIIQPLSKMSNLSEHLDKSKADRIRAATQTLPRRKQRTGFDNPIYHEACEMLTTPNQVRDILTGVIQTVGERTNYKRIFNLFQSLEYIDTNHVSKITGLEERQSRRYVQICRIALPHLIRYFKSHSLEEFKKI